MDLRKLTPDVKDIDQRKLNASMETKAPLKFAVTDFIGATKTRRYCHPPMSEATPHQGSLRPSQLPS